METPPPYSRTSGGSLSNLAARQGQPAPWIGHMDATTASIRAFEDGVRDGHMHSIGQRKPCIGGSFLELSYLRGVAYGAFEYRRNDDAANPTDRFDVTRDPYTRRIHNLTPRPWLPPAITAPPFQRAERPARHVSQRPPNPAVVCFPQLPLPEGIDRAGLTVSWEPALRDQLFNFEGFGCWITHECSLSPASTTGVADAAIHASRSLFPDQPPVTIHFPNTMITRALGTIFASGSREQIRTLVRAKFIATPRMNIIIFPNRPRRSTFVCTFKSASYVFADYVEVMDAVRDALNDSVEATNLCREFGEDPLEVFSSLSLEYVEARGETMWNVSLEPPYHSHEGRAIWRRTISMLRPVDGNGDEMCSVQLICEVCGCCRHEADACPTRSYEEWTGAIMNTPNAEQM